MLFTWLAMTFAMAGSVAVVVDGTIAPANLAESLTEELARLEAGLEVEESDVYAGAPLYIGGGSLFEGMAVTLMGELTVGTVLTLLLVPVLYALFFGVVPESEAS